MSLYDRFRYRMSLEWITLYFWTSRKLAGLRGRRASLFPSNPIECQTRK